MKSIIPLTMTAMLMYGAMGCMPSKEKEDNLKERSVEIEIGVGTFITSKEYNERFRELYNSGELKEGVDYHPFKPNK